MFERDDSEIFAPINIYTIPFLLWFFTLISFIFTLNYLTIDKFKNSVVFPLQIQDNV